MGDEVIKKIRKVCLSFPETAEKLSWGAPTFRVRDRMFAMYLNNHHQDGRVAVWCNAPLHVQEMAVQDDPKNFFVPPYVGKSGWVGMRLDLGISWKRASAMLDQAYRWTEERAPKKRRPAAKK